MAGYPDTAADTLGRSRPDRFARWLDRGVAGVIPPFLVAILWEDYRAAQDLLRNGASLPQIMVKGGWTKVDTVMRYVEKTSIEPIIMIQAFQEPANLLRQ